MAQQGGSASAGNADILWSADIDDRTGTFFMTFQDRLSGLTAQTNIAFRAADKGARQFGLAVGVAGGAVGALLTELLRLGRQGVAVFMDLVKGSVMVAARADTLAIALETVGATAGYTTEELEELEKAVMSNGITTSAARKTLLQLAQAELDLAKAVDLSRIAQDAAVIAGINSSEATERMLHGIVSLNPLILRHMGLYVDLTQEYIKATGQSYEVVRSLSTRQKQQIALNAVIEAGARIEGTYEAAMETAGKQAGSTARFMEELQLEIGKIAQPAFLEFITRFNGFLIDMTEYLQDNEEAAIGMANALASGMETALDLVERLVAILKAVPEILIGIEARIVQLVNGMSDEETVKRVQDLWLHARQALALWTRQFVESFVRLIEIIKVVIQLLELMFMSLESIVKLLRGEDLASVMETMQEAVDRVTERIANLGDVAIDASHKAMIAMSEFLGLIEDTDTAAKRAERAVVNSMKRMQQEVGELVQKITELNDKIAKDLAEAAIQAEREAIEEAIRNAQRLEDIARRHVQRIDDIYRRHRRRLAELDAEGREDEEDAADDAADKREKLHRDHLYNLLEIEIDYRRTLEDIRRNFERDATEAARSNDAVQVARLLRQRSRDIEDAGIDRGRDIEDEKREYAKRLQDLREQEAKILKEKKKAADKRRKELQRQLEHELEDAEIARERDLENLRLAQERDRQLKELHRKWDMEDMWRKYEEDLRMLGWYAADMEYVTESMFMSLLYMHGSYIRDDIIMWDAYYARLRGMAIQHDAAMRSLRPDADNYPEHPERLSYQSGGAGIVTTPTHLTVGEVPEMVMAMPLTSMVRYQHDINMSGSIDVNGVSPSMESDMAPIVMTMLAEFGAKLLAQTGGA